MASPALCTRRPSGSPRHPGEPTQNFDYNGQLYDLRACVDGFAIRAVFGTAENPFFFRMPIDRDGVFEATFDGDGAVGRFQREPLFEGGLIGDFGRIRLSSPSPGRLSGEYTRPGSSQSPAMQVTVEGSDVFLQGTDGTRAQVSYSLEDGQYFVLIDGRLSQADHLTEEGFIREIALLLGFVTTVSRRIGGLRYLLHIKAPLQMTQEHGKIWSSTPDNRYEYQNPAAF